MKNTRKKLSVLIASLLGFAACDAMAVDELLIYEYFTNGYISAAKDTSKVGLLDKTGKVVIPYQFDNAGKFGEGLLPVVVNEEIGYVDITGKMVIKPFSKSGDNLRVAHFSQGLARMSVANPPKPGDESTTYRYGYIDKNSDWVIKPQFKSALPFDEKGRAEVTTLEGLTYHIDKSGKPLAGELGKDADGGYKDIRSGKIIINAANLAGEFSEGLVDVKIKGKWGFMDLSGKVVIRPVFDAATSFSEGLAPVEVKGKWGYIDHQGKMVIQPQFDSADQFIDGIAGVGVQEKQGYIDKTGNFMVKPEFVSGFLGRFSEGLVAVCNDEDADNVKCGFRDTSGKIVIGMEYDDVGDFHDGMAIVRTNGNYLCIDKSGKVQFQLH